MSPNLQQCLLCPLYNFTMVSGNEAKLEKHMKESHLVGSKQRKFILAIHLLTKTERGRIELWMESRKQELEEKKDDLILIDDEDDDEIECCFDSKEQSINALRSRLFSQKSGKDEKSLENPYKKSLELPYDKSLEVPYENKTVRTKIKPGRSILREREANNVKPAEVFNAQAALAKLLKKINEDEKHGEGTSHEEGKKNRDISIHQSKIQLEKENEDIVDIEQEIEREKAREENKSEKMDSEEEAKAEDVEQNEDVEEMEDTSNEKENKSDCQLEKYDDKEDLEQQIEREKPHKENESKDEATAEDFEQKKDVEAEEDTSNDEEKDFEQMDNEEGEKIRQIRHFLNKCWKKNNEEEEKAKNVKQKKDEEAMEDTLNDKEKELEDMGSEEEEKAKDVEQKKAMEDASNDEEKEFEDMGNEEEEKAKNVVEEEDVESTQARPFHSNIPNLIFSTLL